MAEIITRKVTTVFLGGPLVMNVEHGLFLIQRNRSRFVNVEYRIGETPVVLKTMKKYKRGLKMTQPEYSNWHTNWSYVKSVIRIIACLATMMLGSVFVLAIGLLIAECVGIVEEFG